jgi:hypothetical protein
MLRNIYFAKLQCLIRYSIIVWGGDIESIKILKIKKGCFIQLNGLYERGSCRQIFKELNILTVTMFYIFEVLGYIKKKYLRRNLNMCEYKMRRKCDFHVLFFFLSLFKSKVIYVGIRL